MSKRWIQFGCAVIAMIMIANLQYAWTLIRPTDTGCSQIGRCLPSSGHSRSSSFWKHGSPLWKAG